MWSWKYSNDFHMQMAQYQVSCMYVWVPPSPGYRHRRFTDQPIAFLWSPNTLLIQCLLWVSDMRWGAFCRCHLLGSSASPVALCSVAGSWLPEDQESFLPVSSHIPHSWQEGETRAHTDKPCTQWLSGPTWKLAVNLGAAVQFSRWPAWRGCRTEQPAVEGRNALPFPS